MKIGTNFRNQKHWNKTEILILQRNYRNKDISKLQKWLHRSIKAIRNKASTLHLKKGKYEGLRHHNWKGTKASLNAIHIWVKRFKPKPKLCESCKKNKPFDLANISQKYMRKINDYEWLCRKCHMIKDKRMKNLKQYQGGKNWI